MESVPELEQPRVLNDEQRIGLANSILSEVDNEPWKDEAKASWDQVRTYVPKFIGLVNHLEDATHQKHPEISEDTDIIYIDSGPGPYSYKLLEEGKSDLDDVNYHKWKWSRKMDRARIRAAYAIAGQVTAKRLERVRGVFVDPGSLTAEDFSTHGPTLMYTSVDWQAKHIRNAISLSRALGTFKVPDEKILMYEEFMAKDGTKKPITHTEDQMEGLQLPLIDSNPPRRVVFVSHPAHMAHLLYDLGRYPENVPSETRLSLFPIPTPKAAGTEYTKAEALGTLKQILKGRASFQPYTNYEL